MYSEHCSLRTLSCDSDVSTTVLPKLALSVHVFTGKLGQTSKGNMHQLELTKTEIYLKNHLLLRILAVSVDMDLI